MKVDMSDFALVAHHDSDSVELVFINTQFLVKVYSRSEITSWPEDYWRTAIAMDVKAFCEKEGLELIDT